MRILLVSTYSPAAVGGIGQFVHDLGIELARRGNRVTAIYRHERPEFPITPGLHESVRLVEVYPWNLRGLRTLSVNAWTSRWIRRHGGEFDVIHVLNPMPMAAAGIRAGHRYDIPSVATIYAKYPRSPKRFLRWMNERAQDIVLREADVLVYESANTMRDFAPFAGRVILNGIDTGYFGPRDDVRRRTRESLEIEGDRFVILFLGRMDRVKGIYLFLESVAALKRQVDGFVCLLVGSIDVPDLQVRIEQFHIGDVVKVIGPVGKLDVLDYYCASDLFVLPSYLEGISSSLIEAMACGLPVVATNVGGNPEVVRDEVDGFLVEPGIPDTLATAMRRLIDDRHLARVLGRSARERIEDRFGLRAMADRYLQAYEEAKSTSLRTPGSP